MTAVAFKNARVVRSSWLEEGGRRLDCNPYMSGALEARDALRRLKVRKDALSEVTSGFCGGIFNGPQFARIWVDDPRYGVPFLSGSDILNADLSVLPLLQADYAKSKNLAHLRLEQGMTLITCSGTIGRMTYVRPDMAGMWSSQHIMKVVPNPDCIPPGYLYAFLSSRFGVPLVVSGTYGAIIQHIEPQHISQLPVPRFEKDFEAQVDQIIKSAAADVSEANQLMKLSTAGLLHSIGRDDVYDSDWHADTRARGWEERAITSESLRAFNYDPRIAEIRHQIELGQHSQLGSICDPSQFKGKIIFTRIDADAEYGVMLLGQRNAFHLRPEGRCISEKSIRGLGLRVPVGTTLIPSHGTLGEFELYCRALMVTKQTSKYAYSGDFFRCVPIADLIAPGYLFAFMRSRLAFRMLRSISSGGKQQEQHAAMMYRLPIPRLERERESEIAAMVETACELYDQAVGAEDKARALVESAVIGGEA